MDRERYGGGGRGGAGGGAGPRGGGGGGRGINRYPDVSNRPRPVGPGPAREDRGYGRPDRAAAPAPRNSSEPWSDVPPELEALLRAQVAQKPAPVRTVRVPDDEPSSEDLLGSGVAESPADAVAEPAGRGRTSRRPAARAPRTEVASESTVTTAAVVDAALGAEPEAAPRRRPGRPRKEAPTEAAAGSATEVATAAPRATRAATAKPKAAAKPRTTRKASSASEGSVATVDGADAAAPDGADAPAAPKRRTARKASTVEPA